jgi:hypothetical protein
MTDNNNDHRIKNFFLLSGTQLEVEYKEKFDTAQKLLSANGKADCLRKMIDYIITNIK